MPSRYVALLRGVNVGGNNKLPMKDLPAIFQKCGCTNVRTYIQSGNVVFDCTATAVSKLSETIGNGIEKKFGFKPAIVLRSLLEFDNIVRSNPYPGLGAAESELHVVFLEAAPLPAEIAKLEQYRELPEEFDVCGKDVYLRMPNGMARSKMAGVRFKTVATARNWRTVHKLLAMMKAE